MTGGPSPQARLAEIASTRPQYLLSPASGTPRSAMEAGERATLPPHPPVGVVMLVYSSRVPSERVMADTQRLWTTVQNPQER
jgi:hypothetical protein